MLYCRMKHTNRTKKSNFHVLVLPFQSVFVRVVTFLDQFCSFFFFLSLLKIKKHIQFINEKLRFILNFHNFFLLFCNFAMVFVFHLTMNRVSERKRKRRKKNCFFSTILMRIYTKTEIDKSILIGLFIHFLVSDREE